MHGTLSVSLCLPPSPSVSLRLPLPPGQSPGISAASSQSVSRRWTWGTWSVCRSRALLDDDGYLVDSSTDVPAAYQRTKHRCMPTVVDRTTVQYCTLGPSDPPPPPGTCHRQLHPARRRSNARPRAPLPLQREDFGTSQRARARSGIITTMGDCPDTPRARPEQ
nr:hypothetical protein CFP56_20231 [Quercus suber]